VSKKSAKKKPLFWVKSRNEEHYEKQYIMLSVIIVSPNEPDRTQGSTFPIFQLKKLLTLFNNNKKYVESKQFLDILNLLEITLDVGLKSDNNLL